MDALSSADPPDTKIDWDAYMQQVDMFISGERDYSKIEGETGPLVYVFTKLSLSPVFQLTMQIPRSPPLHLQGLPRLSPRAWP